MKKRLLKISALVVAVILIVGVALFANALVGNPISKMIAKHTAEEHLEEAYADSLVGSDVIQCLCEQPLFQESSEGCLNL